MLNRHMFHPQIENFTSSNRIPFVDEIFGQPCEIASVGNGIFAGFRIVVNIVAAHSSPVPIHRNVVHFVGIYKAHIKRISWVYRGFNRHQFIGNTFHFQIIFHPQVIIIAKTAAGEINRAFPIIIGDNIEH